MFICNDCSEVFEDPVELTEDDIRDHFENGGFSHVPQHALDRAGTHVCPACLGANWGPEEEDESEAS